MIASWIDVLSGSIAPLDGIGHAPVEEKEQAAVKVEEIDREREETLECTIS